MWVTSLNGDTHGEQRNSYTYTFLIPLFFVILEIASLFPTQIIFHTNSSKLLLLFSHLITSHSLWPHRLQHASFPCPSPSPRTSSNTRSLVSDAIQPLHLLSSPSPPAFNLSPNQGLFKWVNSSYQVAKVLELQFQHRSFQWIFRTDLLEEWLMWSPYSPRGCQGSPSTTQFKNINSLAFSLLYGPTLTSVHDYWKT